MNYIMTVINPDALKKLSDICAQLEIPLSVALHGRGTAIESMRDLLGIDSTEKWIVFSVAGEEKTKEYMNRLRRTLYIGVPGHGIAWAVPIKSVGGGKILAYLNDGRQDARYTPEFNFSYELIVAIANEGRTDAVMNAARAAGAMGGTVLHGKGTTSPESEKFLGVSIAKEKEVILIVARKEQKADIMRSIMTRAGADTDAGARSVVALRDGRMDRIDLHTHSTASDGSMTPAELVRHAKASGLRAMALSDHDTVDGVDEAMAAGRESGIEVIPAIELSAVSATETHILGYFIDPHAPSLTSALDRIRAIRVERLTETCGMLRDHGIDVSIDEVRAIAGGGVLCRAHIARIMTVLQEQESAR